MLYGAATIERYGDRFVARDDLLPGGAKSRFVPDIVPSNACELVFGAPFCGGAPVALAVEGQRRGLPVTIFYAARAVLSPRQQRVAALGARLECVRPGYMTVVQKRARDYCAQTGAHFFPLGFDVPEAEEPMIESLRAAAPGNEFPEIWCATGSGMLARCIATAFPKTKVMATAVGLRSRWSVQTFPPNVQITEAAERFEQQTWASAPFPSCGHYDRKAWARCEMLGAPGALFWNVMIDG